MKKKLMMLGLILGLNGALCANELDSSDEGDSVDIPDVAEYCQDDIQEFVRKRQEDIASFFTLQKKPEFEQAIIQLLTIAPVLIKHLPVNAISRLNTFVEPNFFSDFTVKSFKDLSSVELDAKLRKILFLLCIVTKDTSINISIKHSGKDYFESIHPAAQGLIKLEKPTIYETHKKKIQFMALCSLALFLFNYRDLLKNNIVAQKFFVFMQQLFSTVKSYATPKFFIALAAVKKSFDYFFRVNSINLSSDDLLNQ